MYLCLYVTCLESCVCQHLNAEGALFGMTEKGDVSAQLAIIVAGKSISHNILVTHLEHCYVLKPQKELIPTNPMKLDRIWWSVVIWSGCLRSLASQCIRSSSMATVSCLYVLYESCTKENFFNINPARQQVSQLQPWLEYIPMPDTDASQIWPGDDLKGSQSTSPATSSRLDLNKMFFLYHGECTLAGVPGMKLKI